MQRDGEYMIDPDGFAGEAPVTVSCNMTGKNGQAGTMISHDSEAKTLVKGYEERQSYRRDIYYSMPQKQLVVLMMLSEHCEQFIRYDCLGSRLMNLTSAKIKPYGAWKSQSGEIMTYWGGADHGSGMCACSMTRSCDKPSMKCNCDANDYVWRFDEGYLTNKETLPVTKVYFGDTGHPDERGYHTLGKLICYGTQT